jgi:hypothetical protein
MSLHNNFQIKIQKIINNITNEKLEIIIPDQLIIKYIIILKQITKNIPNNIKNYNLNLVQVKNISKCINCHRDAEYMINNNEKEIYCWRHSQLLIKN